MNSTPEIFLVSSLSSHSSFPLFRARSRKIFQPSSFFHFSKRIFCHAQARAKKKKGEKGGGYLTTLSNTLNYQFSIADYTSKMKKKEHIELIKHRVDSQLELFFSSILQTSSFLHIITIIDRDRRSIMISFHPIMI